jgi:hypothetical protein
LVQWCWHIPNALQRDLRSANYLQRAFAPVHSPPLLGFLGLVYLPATMQSMFLLSCLMAQLRQRQFLQRLKHAAM